MNFDGKRILVTGAAGFIGSNIVSKLLSYDCKVIGVDNFYSGQMENVKKFLNHSNFSLMKVDIRDYHYLRKMLNGIDIIFHQAALTNVTQSVDAPFSTNEVNVIGTLNLLMLARELDVERFVFASSSSVYGEDAARPTPEEIRLCPLSPYGVSKLAAESYVYSFYKVYGTKTVSLRYFNVYGPNQIASPYSGVISIFIARVSNGQAPIIYGDGTQTRDFTFVGDAVQANLLAATQDKAIGQVFNVGTGNQISILELAKAILKILNKPDLKIQFEPGRPGDIPHSQADISRAKKILNFTPQFTLQKGLTETINWFKERGPD